MKDPEAIQTISSRILPLSCGQRSIWLGQQYLGEESPAFVTGGLYTIRGPLDTAVLRRALEELTQRHRTLRSFLRPGHPFPHLEPQETFKLPFTFHDVSHLPDPASAAAEIANRGHEEPFVLRDSPLCRFMLVKESDSKHFFVTAFHHIITDGWGAVVAFNEAATIYNRLIGANGAELPAPVDYGEFLEAEQKYEASEKFRADRAFWREHLQDADLLPLFSPLPGREAGFGPTKRLYRHLPPGLLAGLADPAGQGGATATSALLAATALFFSRLCDRDRMIIGFPFLNRKSRRFRQIIGHFTNILPLSIPLNMEQPFHATASEAAKRLRSVMRHAAHPVDEVVGELGIRPQDSGALFQVSLNHVAKSSAGRLDRAEVVLTPISNHREHRILGISVWELGEEGEAEVTFDYCLNYFTREAAETVLNRYTAFLERLAGSPDLPCGDHDLLLPEEASNIERWSSGPPIARRLDCRIHEAFEESAEAHGMLSAVMEGDSRTTYRELDLSANRVANALLAAGVRREEPVGVLACRSGNLAATVLGIWKAGGCYLPLDPEYPAERIRFIVDDARLRTVIALCAPSCPIPARTLPFSGTQRHPASSPRIAGSGSDLAYIIYTSGSTGTPKGVAIEHGSFLNMIAGQIAFLSMKPQDRVLLFASPCFDASLSEIFMALLAGAALCPVGRDLMDTPWDLRDYMMRLGVSVATFPPSYLRVFQGEDLPGMRALITAGEPPNPEDARRYAARLQYINAYGPTENSVCSTMGRVSPNGEGPMTIGRPIPNVRTHILDRRLRPVPPDVPGELCLSGPGLAREYLNRPDLMAACFVQAPFAPHERLYRSGDLARWTPDGEIEFLGRKDDQVKVRGFRVEPGEIENALASHPAVLQATVVAQDTGGACSLNAFIVFKPDAPPVQPEEIRDWIAGRLPGYMHPSRITALECLPTNTAGKIDRKRLSAMALAGPIAPEFVPPRSATESAMAAIWEDCLRQGPMGARDDFFARGGNSLLAIRMAQRIIDTFGITIPVRSVFRTPVLCDLCGLVDAARRDHPIACGSQPKDDGNHRGNNRRLSEAQRQLWVIHQMADTPEVYNMPAVFDVESDGSLDSGPWEEALKAVIRRHESLRTVFMEEDGVPMRTVLDAVPFHLETSDSASRHEAVAFATDRVHEPFDPAVPPLIRAGLVRYAPGRAIFHLCVHHLVGDGESILIIMDEFTRNLGGSEPTAPACPYSLAVAEEMRYLASEDAVRDRQWWLAHLAPPLPALDLALGVARPRVKGYAGERRGTHIPSETMAGIKELARQSHASLFSLMLALVKTIIHRRTGERDIIVGIPSTARTRAEHQGSVGDYVNTIAIRDVLDVKWSFQDLLTRVHASVAAAVEHGAYPFARLYADLGLIRDPSRSPVFDVMLAPQPAAREMVRNGLVFRGVDIQARAARFDLIFTYAEEPDGSLALFADYDSALFLPQAVEAMLAELTGLAEEVRIDSLAPIRGAVRKNRTKEPGRAAEWETAIDAPPPGEGKKHMCGLLTEAWQSVLGAPVAPTDNFFSLGGDSIKAIQVCGTLRKAGVKLSPRQIFENPVLGDLAEIVRSMAQRVPTLGVSPSPEPPPTGSAQIPLTPIQRWLLEDHPESAPSFLMNVLLTVKPDMEAERIEKAVRRVAACHDAFRLLIEDAASGMMRSPADAPEVYWRVRRLGEGESFEETLKALAPMIHRRIDPGRGCHLAAMLMQAPGESRLYLAAHHLMMDAVSWRIFLDDLETACRPGDIVLPPPSAPFSAWAVDLNRYAASEAVREELPYWRGVCSAPSGKLPVLDGTVRNVWSQCCRHTFELEPDITRNLITEAASRRGVRPVELLLTGLSLVLGRRITGDSITLFLEGHGREPCASPLDVSRTLGWFTCRYPFRLGLGRQDENSALGRIIEDFRAVPQNGIGHGVLQRLAGEDLRVKPEVTVNYLGEFSGSGPIFCLAPESAPSPVGPEYESDARLELLAVILDGNLRVEALFHPSILDATWIAGLMEDLRDILCDLAKPVPQAEPLGLTPTQEGMLFHVLAEPESRVYRQQMTFRLAGPADPLRLLSAWRLVAARHESLRAVFSRAPNGPVQTFMAEPPHVITLTDLSGLTEEGRNREVEAFLQWEKSRDLDIERGPTFRAAVLRLGPDEHLLTWTFHHILMDGWCIAILLRETLQALARLDAGLPPSLPSAPSPRAYMAWLKEKDREADARFWKAYLAGFASATGIPGSLGVPPGPYVPQEMELRLDSRQTRRLADTAASLGSTPSLLLQAAWGIFLARHCNARDVVFGLVTSGREADIDGMENMVGVFIRTVPVRMHLEDPQEAFSSVVLRLQGEAAARLPHEALPLPDILASSPIGSSLLNHILVIENYPAEGIDGPGPKISEVKGSEQLPYDLGVSVVPGRELLFRFSFNEGVYSCRLMEQIRKRWMTLLDSILDDPNKAALCLPVLPREEQDRMVGFAGETIRSWPDSRPFPAFFAERAKLYRDRPAIVEPDESGDGIVTYGQLAAMTAGLSQSLIRFGAGPHKPVAVCLDRSSRLVAALLAVMDAGAPYVPLDPSYPAERLRWIMEDSGAALVLAEKATAAVLMNARPESMPTMIIDDMPPESQAQPDARLSCRPGPDDLAYIIYTSGSTGTPKGVEIPHGGLINFLLSFAESPGLSADDKVLSLSTICFDIHIVEMFLPLLVGGRMVMASREVGLDGRRVAQLLDRTEVTLLQATPTTWRMLMESGWKGRKGLKALVGGEPLLPGLARQMLARCGEVWDIYGTTEVSVWSTVKRIQGDGSTEPEVTIGKPIANTSIHILSDDLVPMPDGAVGELCIGGAGLARGYRNRPELSRSRFVHLSFPPGERIYRTGDLACRNPDGELLCLGRNDFQVKVRGFRIEPGEVETRLCAIPGVRRAVVKAGDFRGSGQELAAFIAGDNPPADDDLRERLRSELPDYMVPSIFVRLTELPSLPNGKVDRLGLTVPEVRCEPKPPIRPLTETERLIAGLWRDILRVTEVDPTDNFFSLGGHSLMAMRLAAAIESETGLNTPVRTVFDHPTLELQARFIEGRTPTPPSDEDLPIFDGLALSEEEMETLRNLAGA